MANWLPLNFSLFLSKPELDRCQNYKNKDKSFFDILGQASARLKTSLALEFQKLFSTALALLNTVFLLSWATQLRIVNPFDCI